MQTDLLVYHDMHDTKHDAAPAIGQNAVEWYGKDFDGLYVTAVADGIHEGRITVVLSAEHRPEMQQEIKAFFAR